MLLLSPDILSLVVRKLAPPPDPIRMPAHTRRKIQTLARLAQTDKGNAKTLRRIVQPLSKLYGLLKVQEGLLKVQENLLLKVKEELLEVEESQRAQIFRERFTPKSILLHPRTYSLVVKTAVVDSRFAPYKNMLTIKPCQNGLRTMQFERFERNFLPEILRKQLVWSICLNPARLIIEFDAYRGVIMHGPGKTQYHRRSWKEQSSTILLEEGGHPVCKNTTIFASGRCSTIRFIDDGTTGDWQVYEIGHKFFA